MTKEQEALKLALEALNHLQPTALTSFYTIGDRDKAITAIKEALAQPVQEPAAWLTEERYAQLHTAQRTWVGLTDEEVDEWTPEIHTVIRAIEAKLKEKNT